MERILEAAPDAVITLDEDHRVVEWNPGARRLFGYSAEEAAGKVIDDLVAPPQTAVGEEARELSKLVLKQHTIPSTETTRYHRDGTAIPVMITAAPIVSEGVTVGGVATYKDLSARKSAEEQAEKLLEENKLLLKEAYHRIKNDMLLISSILALQARRTEDGAAREAIESAQNRVGVIGDMYQGFYTVGSFQAVSMQEVCERCVNRFAESPGVTVSGSWDTASLSPRPAVAVAVIINELVTNAVKHARGEAGASSSVTVEIRRRSPQEVFVAVRDNGPGYPEAVLADEGRRLGLDIVHALTEQYDGTITLRNDNGAVAELLLSIPE